MSAFDPHPSPLGRAELVDEYFIESRNRIIEVAAFLDRLDRVDDRAAERDYRMAALTEAIAILGSQSRSRVQEIQMLLSDPTTEPLPALDRKGAVGAWDRARKGR